MKKRVVCAISGGVDSAVAALILKQKGYDVLGSFMRNWDLRDETGHCSMEEDCHFAERVCKTLKIPFHEVNFVKEYWNHVFQETVDEYERGHTPNPDVLCNKYIKFDAFLKYAHQKFNVPLIATGHYARTSENIGLKFSTNKQSDSFQTKEFVRPCLNNGSLYKAVDENKDQTFFLNKISSWAIKHILFPVGGMLKHSVKEMASANGLNFISKRKESMGICFIGLRDFNAFIQDYIPPKMGKFICIETGKVLGEHDGYFKYTIGQRTRLAGFSTAFFVAGKNKHSGNIFVAPGTSHPSLFSNAFIIETPHWINQKPTRFEEEGKYQCDVRVMHREPVIRCELFTLTPSECLVILEQPMRCLTPGQAAVLYSDIECLGGSRILSAGPSVHESYNGILNLFYFRTDAEKWVDIFDKFGDAILPYGENIIDEIHQYQNMLKLIH